MNTPRLGLVALCAGAVFLTPCAAVADIFFEVTEAGQLPDGKWGTTPGGVAIPYDVWMWGTGPDRVLFAAMFNVGAVNSGDTLISGLGKANPGGEFTSSKDGVIGFFPDTIFEVVVLALPPGVDIGDSPATATRIYANFTSAFQVAAGRLDTSGWSITTGGGSNPAVHSYGIVETPTPGSAAMIVAAGLVLASRRSRS